MTPNPIVFELITLDNIRELQPGEWIWDSATIRRRAHKRSLWGDTVEEPVGFRQIHIIDVDSIIPRLKPFMLSNADEYKGGYVWENFHDNRFYRFRKDLK